MSTTRTIVFSHANGFGAGTYRVMFEQWRAAGWQVLAVERFGHDARYPVASNWRALRDQLLDFISENAPGKVYLVGHSLGGLLSLLAACRRPDLAAGLVMLDSPVITGWRAHSLQVLKHSRLIGKVSPGKVSQKRRYQWPHREAVYEHFKSKSAFARWDDRVLRDYVNTGFDEVAGHIELGFQRDVETSIYNTLPHHLGPLLAKHPPQCPVGFIAGTQSLEMRQGGVATAKAMAKDRFVQFEGGHLYPMEQPEATGAEVLRLLETMAHADRASV